MNNKILFVDDDERILRGYKRLLMEKFNITAFSDPVEAIKHLKIDNSFSVIISDFKMPGMDGVRFLGIAREIAPETTRIMLTGNADLETAVNAVNNGNIFRLLLKPCDNDILLRAIRDGIDLYQLQVAEKELLEKTLRGSVKILMDVLSITKPEAFSFAQQSRKLASKIGKRLKLENLWEIELAAMLSNIGYVTIPHEVVNKIYKGEALDKYEAEIYKTHPAIAEKLISNVPRLENIAEGIGLQMSPKLKIEKSDNINVKWIGRVLKLVTDFRKDILSSKNEKEALEKIRVNSQEYDDDAFAALVAEIMSVDEQYIVREYKVEELEDGMILAENILDENKNLIIPKLSEVTSIIRMRLQNFVKVGRTIPFIKILEKVSKE